MKKRGSALIIALLIMATVGGIAFGIGRLFFLNQNIASLYESSVIAYYSAESGIEEGMLRYRYDKNSQLPNPYDENMMMRSNVSDANSVVKLDRDVSISTSKLDLKYYDLNMNYLADVYGDDRDGNGVLTQAEFEANDYNKIYWLEQDEAIKIDVTNIVTNNSDIMLYVQADKTQCSNKLYFESKVTSTVMGELKEIKAVLLPENYIGSNLEGYVTLFDFNSNVNPKTYRRNNLLGEIRSISTAAPFSGQTELYLKPIGCGAKIGMFATISDVQIASPYTTIHSVGHFGGVTRTLIANIDRQSGTLYDIYDFVIYQYGNAPGGSSPFFLTNPNIVPPPVF